MAEIILHIYRKTLEIIWLTCHLSLHWLLKFQYLCWYHPMSTPNIKYQHRKHNTHLFRVNLLRTSAFDKESHLLICSSFYSYLPVFFFVGLKCSQEWCAMLRKVLIKSSGGATSERMANAAFWLGGLPRHSGGRAPLRRLCATAAGSRRGETHAPRYRHLSVIRDK